MAGLLAPSGAGLLARSAPQAPNWNALNMQPAAPAAPNWNALNLSSPQPANAGLLARPSAAPDFSQYVSKPLFSLTPTPNVNSSQPYTQNPILDNPDQANAAIDTFYRKVLPITPVIAESLKQKSFAPLIDYEKKNFSEQVQVGAHSDGTPIYMPRWLNDYASAFAMHGDGSAPLTEMHPHDVAFLQEAADHVVNGRSLAPEDWSLVQHTMAHYNMETPSTPAKFADFIQTATQSNAEAAMTKDSMQPAVNNPSKLSTPLQTLKPQPRQANGWWSSFKNAISDQRGMIRNPLAGGGDLPEEVPTPESSPNGSTENSGALLPGGVPKTPEMQQLQQAMMKKNTDAIEAYKTDTALGRQLQIEAGTLGERYNALLEQQKAKGAIPSTEIKTVANNLMKNNPGISQTDAEAMAKDVIQNRKFNTPSDTGTPAPNPEAGAPNTELPTGETPKSGLPGPFQQAASSRGNTIPDRLRVNPDHLNIDDQSKQLLENLSSDLSSKTAAKVGAPMTDQEVMDFAKANPNLTQNAVSRDASLKANAAMLQARQKLAAQMESLQNGTASVADKGEIIKNFLAVKTAATDLGRSLQKMSVSADPSEGSTIGDIISKIAKTGANVDDIIAAAKHVDFNDYNQVVSFYRQFVKPTAGDWVDLVRYNSMLSSPLTLSNISMGNAANLVTQPVVKAAAGAIDWMKTGVFGGKQTHFIGEGPAYAKGAVQNIGEAFKNMTDVLTGNLDPKMLDFNVPIASEGAKGTFVKSMNVFSTLHNAMYQFFNTIAKGGSEASIAYKAGQGAATPLADLAAQAEADYATFRAGTNPEGQGHILNAIDSVANSFKQWSASDNPMLKWPTRFTLPFLRISTNMAKQMVEFSPAGFATTYGAADPITQVAKASLGTAAFAAIGTLAATGNITGAAPTVPADKQAFTASGRQAYSVKIGNTWVSYNKLPPSMSIPMLLAGSYMQSQATGVNKDKMQSVLDAFGSFGKYIADQSYVKNVGDLVSAIQGDTSKGNALDTLITNDAQQLLPFRAFSGWLAKLLDPYQRQIDSSKSAIEKQVQSIMLQIPGIREQLPAKTDAAGNPIPNQNRLANAFSPVQTSQSTPQQDKGFQDYNTLKTLNTQSMQQSKALTTQATTELQHIQSLPDSQSKKDYLKTLAGDNPDLAKKVIDLLSQPQGLNATEKKMAGMATNARAQFIAQQRSIFASGDEYKAYLSDLASKKILTADTLKELAKIFNNK